MRTSEALYAAADYIRKRGWNRGDFENSRGGVCIAGAINRVTPRGDYLRSTIQLFMSEIVGCATVAFNDVHCKTADDAVAALEIAADIAAAEGR